MREYTFKQTYQLIFEKQEVVVFIYHMKVYMYVSKIFYSTRTTITDCCNLKFVNFKMFNLSYIVYVRNVSM